MEISTDEYEEPWNFSWIVPNFLAGSSCPDSVSNLNFFRLQGISHLVTLSPNHKPPEINISGLQKSFIPINEFEAPTLHDMQKFIELAKNCRENKEGMVIHCRAGRGRTGTMAAIYFVFFYNLAPETAITKIRLLRPGSVETYAQEKAVAEYRDYLRAKGPL